jgi:hypothetical protein
MPDNDSAPAPEMKPGYASSEVQAFPAIGLLTWAISSGLIHVDDPRVQYMLYGLIALAWIGWIVLFAGRTWLKAHHAKALYYIQIAQTNAELIAAAIEKAKGVNIPLPSHEIPAGTTLGLPPAAAPFLPPAPNQIPGSPVKVLDPVSGRNE